MKIKEIIKRIDDFILFNYPEHFLKFIKIELYHLWYFIPPFIFFIDNGDIRVFILNIFFMMVCVVMTNMFTYIDELRRKNANLELANRQLQIDFNWQRYIISTLQKLYIELQQKSNIHFTNDEIKFLLKVAHPDKNNNSNLSNSVTRKLLILKRL